MFSKSLKFMSTILIYIGITYLCGPKKQNYTTKYYWQAFCFVMSGGIILPQVAYTITHSDDLILLAECFLIIVTFFMAFVNLACHIFNRDEIKDTIDAFIFDKFEHRIPLLSNLLDGKTDGKILKELERFSKESNEKLQTIIKYCLMVYSGTGFTTVIMQAVKPITMGLFFSETHYREFPYCMSFPWNQTETPIYQVTFLLHVCFGVSCATCYVGLDCLFALLLGHIIRQLMIVDFIMSHLDELVAEVREKHSDEWERDCTTLLTNCAQHVVRLKWYCRRLNTIYKPYLVVQAVMMSAVVCICMLMLTKTESEGKFNLQNLTYITFEVTAMFQICMYCGIGQILKDMSSNLQDKVLGSWWEHGRKHQSCIKILLLAVQRPITMHIWGTIELSYPTIGAITKTAVSYFTLLQTVTEK